jgi:cytochrome c oxidase assembly protein subunit 15
LYRSFVIFRSLISLSLLLTLLTVILSAYIRLAEVGIGCEDWPECYAQLDPGAEQRGVTVLTESGRDMAHYGARVAHRYIASVLGVFIVVLFIQSLRRRAMAATSLWVPAAIFAITVFLSLLGYYTPTRSNPLITMGNLLGGMALLGLLWWQLQREAAQSTGDGEGLTTALRGLAKCALLLVMIQVVLGGWASANYASASCPGLISCEQGVDVLLAASGNMFDPSRSIELDASGQVIQSDGTGILSMAHRFFALLTAAYLAWMVRRLKPVSELGSTLVALSVCSIGQLVLGVSMVWLDLPLWMVAAHNGLAACLLLAAINLLNRLTPPIRLQPPG